MTNSHQNSKEVNEKIAEQHRKEKHNELIISYLTQRKIIGILGILLPVSLWLYSCIKGETIQISISHYYFTQMRNLFVAIICVVSVFLLTYKGYETIDRVVSLLAGFFGLIVVFIHTSYKNPSEPCLHVSEPITGMTHLISAGLFLLCLAFMSGFLFIKTTPGVKKVVGRKRIRNIIYIACAVVMVLCVVIMIMYFAITPFFNALCERRPVFWLETISLWAFGFSWLIKGETLWRD